jgi:hypothetical protein
MVADATTTPPPSTAAALDSDALLTALLTNQLDSLKTAVDTNTPLSHLIAWTARPEIQKAIDTFRQLQFASVNTRILASTATARIDAVARLHELSKTTTDPIELRRAATLILRYSTPLRWVSWMASRSAAALPSDDTARRAPASSPNPARQAAALTPPPSLESPKPRAHSHTTLPHFATPEQLLRHFERSLTKQRPTTASTRSEAIQNLHRYLAPSALVNTTIAPCEPESLAQTLDAVSVNHLVAHVVHVRSQTRHSDDLSHTATLNIARHRQPLVRADVELKRTTHSAPWRIASITTRLHSG